MRILFYLAVWKRPEITEICFMGLDRLRESFESDVLAVISEEEMIPLCEKYGVKWCMHENLPIGRKKNYGITQALKMDWDYMVELGSDDLIKNELIQKYQPFFGEKDFIGCDNVLFLNTETLSCRWVRKRSMFGLGRCLSRKLVETYPDLYPDKLNNGLDKWIWNRLARKGIFEQKVKSENALTIDLKSEVNIWRYNPSLGEKCSLEFAIQGLSEKEINAIRCFRRENKSADLIGV